MEKSYFNSLGRTTKGESSAPLGGVASPGESAESIAATQRQLQNIEDSAARGKANAAEQQSNIGVAADTEQPVNERLEALDALVREQLFHKLRNWIKEFMKKNALESGAFIVDIPDMNTQATQHINQELQAAINKLVNRDSSKAIPAIVDEVTITKSSNDIPSGVVWENSLVINIKVRLEGTEETSVHTEKLGYSVTKDQLEEIKRRTQS